MKRLVNKIVAVAMAASVLTVTAHAAGHDISLSDHADVLTSAQEELLRERMADTADRIGCNVGIVITNDKNGKTSKVYADDYMDTCFGYGGDSIVLLYDDDFDNPAHCDWISTMGNATDMYDDEIDQIFDYLYLGFDSGSGNNYYEGAVNFCTYLEQHCDESAGVSTPQYGADTVTGMSDVRMDDLFAAVGFAVVFMGGVLSV